MNPRFLREEMEDFARQRSFYNHFVLPDYERRNVKNLSSLIGKIFDVNSLPSSKFPKDYSDEYAEVEKVLLLILDGLGYNRLLTHLENFEGGLFSELNEKGVLKPLTSPFPTTTSTSLASIFTGLSPSEHKIIGYHMFSKEYGLIFNTLDMRPVYGYSSRLEIAKEFSKNVEPWMNALTEQDVKTSIVTKGSIIGGGLSNILYKNQEIIPYSLQTDMLEQCRKTLEKQNRSLITVYYSGIDTLEHKYGPYTEETTFEIQSLECNLKQLLNKLSKATKKRTLFILTADHGVSPTQKYYFLRDFPEILENLRLPSVGDSRATFLFSKQSQENDLSSAFNRKIEGFKLLPSRELIENEAYGRNPDLKSLEGIVGDFTALGSSQSALQYPYFDKDRTRTQPGSHGGMTPEEIIVPLLSARLSKF
jgi:predicted AlkP superfamily pyrophosphatase or phosphodiesterase